MSAARHRFVTLVGLSIAGVCTGCLHAAEDVLGPTTLSAGGVEIAVARPWNVPATTLDLCIDPTGRFELDFDEGLVSPVGAPPARVRASRAGAHGTGDAARPSSLDVDRGALCWSFHDGPREPGERVTLTADPTLAVRRVYWVRRTYR